MTTPTTATEMQDLIRELLHEHFDNHTDNRLETQTYAESGYLTQDAGLVVDIDGAQFQLTIV